MKKGDGSFVNARLTVILAVITSCFISASVIAGDPPGPPPKGQEQVWTSVEGNIKYYVRVGEKVKKGQPLFFVVTNDYRPEKVAELEHNVEYYKKCFNRDKTLLKTHSVSQQDYDDSEHLHQQAVDDLAVLKASIQQGLYVAPFDCEVTKRLYLNGSGIGDGNPAIDIKPIKIQPKYTEKPTPQNQAK
jgi:hypothetical protein